MNQEFLTNEESMINKEETELSATEEQESAEIMRRNITRLVNSGQLTSEQAEVLARLQVTEQIEVLQEQANQVVQEGLIQIHDGVVDFGKDEYNRQIVMPVFEPSEETWEPKFYPTKSGRYFNIGFISSSGREFINPLDAQAVADDDPTNPETRAAIDVEKTKLQAHLEREKALRYAPPERREEFKETEYSAGVMREIAGTVMRQEAIGRGLLIIEGEAGTGKNWMIDHIGHLTGRPVFRFTCDASKETPELKYFLEFRSEAEGSPPQTVRIPSTIVEALQTEGAILELDEINTLRPDVAKSLNSLFDADRALYFGEDNTKVKAARGVVIIGLMNPSNYVGVKELAETIKSRARIMAVDYPPFLDEDESGDPIKRPDEADLLYQYLPEFDDFSQTDFENLWHLVINGRENSTAQNLLNQARQLRLIQLKTLVAIADHIREAYRQYQENGQGGMISYNFTLRESADCATELSSFSLPANEREAEDQVRHVVKKIFIPKISTVEEKSNIEALISEA